MELREPLVSKIPKSTSYLTNTLDFNIGSMSFDPAYWQAGLIIFLIFLLVMSVARWRHLYVKWNLRGFIPSILFGFILTLILEGLLLVGGRTFLTEILGWENAPKPISTAIDEGRSRLVEVLGETDEISDAVARDIISGEEFVEIYQSLPENEAQEVKEIICKPQP